MSKPCGQTELGVSTWQRAADVLREILNYVRAGDKWTFKINVCLIYQTI